MLVQVQSNQFQPHHRQSNLCYGDQGNVQRGSWKVDIIGIAFVVVAVDLSVEISERV